MSLRDIRTYVLFVPSGQKEHKGRRFLMGAYDFCGAIVFDFAKQNQRGDLILKNISAIISRAVVNKLEQFENDIINNYKVTECIDKKCTYNNVHCRKNILDELNYGIEYKLIDDVITDLENKPFYFAYEIYADPACPQIFKRMSADEFFSFSCYIHELGMEGKHSRSELYKICEKGYKTNPAIFRGIIRECGKRYDI